MGPDVIVNSFEDIIKFLKKCDGNHVLRDGRGHMWRLKNNKLYYKPQFMGLFTEVKIEGGWFSSPVEEISSSVRLYENIS